MRKLQFFVYNIEAGSYLETLFVTAIITMLGVRFFLHITNFPQVSGAGLHIAHMLWGGFFMFASIVLLLAFLTKSTVRFSSVLGGVGFGLFIDELGKFITSDNNYFFQPTIAIIYIIFILIFLMFRFLEKTHRLSQEEYLANAFEATKNAIFDKTDFNKREEAYRLTNLCDPSDPITEELFRMLEKTPVVSEKPTDMLFRIHTKIRILYQALVKKSWFIGSIMFFFIVYSFMQFYESFAIISVYLSTPTPSISVVNLGQFFSTILSTIIVVIGIVRITRSRLAAYKLFKFAVLISIFLTEFFNFYNNQLQALTTLFFNLIVLSILAYVIDHENVTKAHRNSPSLKI